MIKLELEVKQIDDKIVVCEIHNEFKKATPKEVDSALETIIDLFEEKSMEEIVDALSKEYTKEQIEEAYEEIKTLKEEGLLFTEDTYQDHPSFVNRSKGSMFTCFT